jgi:nucleoside-diphosphate-sugar epimerase
MKTLILGASGYIGRRLFNRLGATTWAEPVGAARRGGNADSVGTAVRVDSRNLQDLTLALRQCQCVINCVAGDFDSIANGARTLAQAALAAECKRIIHLSSMSVYGRAEGRVDEQTRLDPGLGWYAHAKCEAETHMNGFAREGGEVVVLRPGCVFGSGSELWVGRVGRWLHAGRVGDLGAAGDGWSNLVHVDDVCDAVLAAMRMPIAGGEMPIFNLAAPDSPRWNEYIVDLAMAINATPVRRISARQLALDSRFAGPPLKVAEKLLDKVGVRHEWLPEPLPPSVVRLWSQEIRLIAQAATQALAISWTSYATALQDCSNWLRSSARR